MKKKKGKKVCMSTHGGAGYALGTILTIYRYKDESGIDIKATFKCMCGYEGKARPAGGRYHYYYFRENPWKWLRGEIKFTEPKWGDWMSRKYIYIDR